jgi:hypothetical protein
MPWRGPAYKGELPTLGYEVLDWLAAELIVPDGPLAGEPLILTEEQAQFVLDLYAVDPKAVGALSRGHFRNHRLIRRAVLSRMKGWGKSPLLAGLSIVEALGPVVPDGWNDQGEPVGRPWASLGFKPKVQIVATAEDQTSNTWEPLLEMVREGPVGVDYDVEALETFVNVPRGKIEPTTSAARSKEGFRLVFAVFDQTESWTPNIGGPKLAAAIRRNLAKVGGTSVETPNAFVKGEGSVAEKSREAWELQEAGKLRGEGILYDHREAPADTDPSDLESLLAGLRHARGDSVWLDLERVVDEYWDPSSDPADSRRFWLNQSDSAVDAWIAGHEWAACADASKVVADRELVTLGFDGSRRRARGVTDATALIGCRVSDGHVFELGVWEQPEGPAGEDWTVPTAQVEAAVEDAFRRFTVVGFYADPARWEGFVAKWEAKHGKKLKVKASREHPVEWWMTGGRSLYIVRALEEFHSAVLDVELTHDGAYALTRHALNARRRPSRSGLQIAKEHPDSSRKIDAVVAAVLAYKARLDAVAAGVGRKTSFVPKRVR